MAAISDHPEGMGPHQTWKDTGCYRETNMEELRGANADLHRKNGELAQRVGELTRANSDLKNLLDSTQIATIFLDTHLRMRSFTPMTLELFFVLETDIGRPISHIANQLDYPELLDDTGKALRTRGTVERTIMNARHDRNYLVRILPYSNVDNVFAGVVLNFLDITASTRIELALRETEARYKLILESSVDHAIIAMDPDGNITAWNAGAQNIFGWTVKEVVGRKGDLIFTPDDREEGLPQREMEEADTEQHSADERWYVRRDGSYFWGAGMLTPMRNGTLSGYLKILRDRTGERNVEDRQKLLLAELQHRVRNILAVVRSLASRTVETSASLEDFLRNFEGRIATLARTQNILTRTSDVAIELNELIRDELLSVGARDGEQIEIAGPVVRLRQRAAETFALAVHELATNALKYGALSQMGGKIVVTWRVFHTQKGHRLTLDWQEQGVRMIDANPDRSGFGRDLIERGLPYELGAATSLRFEPGGLRALIELPLTEKTAVIESHAIGSGSYQ